MALASLAAGAGSLAAGKRDVRGWEVRTLVDDAAAAVVADLLLTAEGGVRWIVLRLADATEVLLPGGQGRADSRRRRMWVPGLSLEQVRLLPPYAGQPDTIDEHAEEALLAGYTAALLRERAAAPAAEPAGDVLPLSSLPEYKVASGEPDPRGWVLAGADGEPLARVEDLLVDPRALKVRHLVCSAPPGSGRRVLLPIAYARLDAASRAVRVPRVTRDALAELPQWSDPAEARDAAAAARARLGAARTAGEDPRLDGGTLLPAKER